MGLPRELDLRHVSAVELEMPGAREHVGDVARERARDKPVASPPDEQRIGLQL